MNEWQTNQPQAEEKEIDLPRLLKILWKRIWLLITIAVIAAVATYLLSAAFITPTYRSSFTAYVNNRVTDAETSSGTTTSDLNASIYLTYLYQDIIISRSVLTDAAESCGLDYTYEQLKRMVSTSVSDNSGLITVYVTDTDPVRATQLATAIAEVAPGHVERMRDGSSMRILDAPVLPQKKYAPSNTKNAVLGAAVAFVLSAIIVIVVDLTNDIVRGAEDLEKRHNVVVVGTIPDLSAPDKEGYGYSHSYGKAGNRK